MVYKLKFVLYGKGVQKIKKLDSKFAHKFFPVHGMSGVTTKKFSQNTLHWLPLFLIGDVKGKYLQNYKVVISQPLCKN